MIKKKQLKFWGILFLAFTFIALVNFTRFITSELVEGQPGKYLFYFIMETTGAYAVLILLPILLWFFRKFLITTHNVYKFLPLYLFASMVFGFCHTMVMYASRLFIYWIANLGAYDYGKLIYRFPMEYTNQFFTFWTVYAVFFIITSIRERQQQKIKTAELEEKLTKARLQALQMQLNPHFLFNTLNMISSTMYENVKAADKMIANLSDLLRLTLSSSGEGEHSIEKELELTDLYIEIMKARFSDKLQIKKEIESETQQALIPGFILQPILENSIKYGIENLDSAEIHIITKKKNTKLSIQISDNGPGLNSDSEQVLQNGVGLSNTVERLEKLYGNDQSFTIQNKNDGGLEVTLEIPFRVSLELECK